MKSRLEKAKIEHCLALVAYMLHPTPEGQLKMKQAADEFAAALTEHRCACTRCLTHSIRVAHNYLVSGKDPLN